MPMEEKFAEDQSRTTERAAKDLLGSLIQASQYVGEVFSLGYEAALVQIHDFHRQQVGGIPSLSFLIATRIGPDASFDYEKEDASVLLLRVMDAAPLPSDADALRVRVENAQRVSGETHTQWDSEEIMDGTTAQILSYAGVRCRVLGTFYLLKKAAETPSGDLILKFGSDISNYYPNRGLKVYKPNAAALAAIVNYRDPDRMRDLETSVSVDIGEIRYASTNRSFQGVSDVPVSLVPEDLRGQKTALFGMTRTGKSNTTKIIAQSVFNLRFGKTMPAAPEEKTLRIGQIIFDYNGEYANENEQDGGKSIPTAIKNVWKSHRDGKQEDVVTYGITPHPKDPRRKLMLLNFFDDANLQIGKEIIDNALARYPDKYLSNFCDIIFDTPPDEDRSAKTRFNRLVLTYRALLFKAGFVSPPDLSPKPRGCFNPELIKAMKESKGKESASHSAAANSFSASEPTWSQIAEAFKGLADFVYDKASGYQAFDNWYMTEKPNRSGDSWADDDLKKLLEMFRYPNGSRLIGNVRDQHTDQTTGDYAEQIYEHLEQGKLVIVDQSSGDDLINKSSADRIMRVVFDKNKQYFREGSDAIPEILVYVEEAHNLLPYGTDLDLKNIWARTAKEGAKYHIGLVYATQEVSSIQRNILKNTSNWFIGHLNNSDETKEIAKYYDFADFVPSILRAQDRGFLRVKTLSNPYVIPVQIRRFVVEERPNAV